MNPKIVAIVFTLVYFTCGVNPANSIKLVTRGYQILDPETGHVLPPAINQGPQKATVNFKRETNKNTFNHHPKATSYSDPPPVPTSYRQQQQPEQSSSRDFHRFPSIYDQFEHPFSGSELSSPSSTAKRHTNFQPHQEYNQFNNGFKESSNDPHYPTRYYQGDEVYTANQGPTSPDTIVYVDNNDLNFKRPSRNKRKKLFKKHVRPSSKPLENNPFHLASFGVRHKRPQRRPSVNIRQPHKQRKKNPYYGRKKRSAEPLPWVLLDPTTGRNIRYPRQFSSSYHPAKKQNQYQKFDQEEKKRKRGQGKISPCFGTYFKEDCNYLLDTAIPEAVEKDTRDNAIPEQVTNYLINTIRQERNLIPVSKSNNNLDPYPIVNRYEKYRYLIGREKGSEYLSRYSGLPIYKYTKKYPHGYGRKKRSPEPMPWAILDPNTGRPIRGGNQRGANTNYNYEQRRRPNHNRHAKQQSTSFFNRGNFRNLNNYLFYDKAEAFDNEIRHERKTNKNNRFGPPSKQKLASTPNLGSEYYDTHSGKPVYKYFKKFPNYGYGRKRRSAEAQKWELIDPITGRNVRPTNNPPIRNQRGPAPFSSPRLPQRNNNQRQRRPQDAIFGQFFQKQTRNERFQPGPQLAPEPALVTNHHQPIAQHPSQGVKIHTGDRDQDHLTSNGRPVYKHHKRYPYLG